MLWAGSSMSSRKQRKVVYFLFIFSFFLSFFLVFFIFFYDWRKITVQRISLQHEAAAAAEAEQKNGYLWVDGGKKGRWTTTPLS